MRRVPLLLLAVVLAACDAFGGPDPTSADALIGRWTCDRLGSGRVVVSDRDQEIADAAAEGRSGFVVSGALDLELAFPLYFDGSVAAFVMEPPANVCTSPNCRASLAISLADSEVGLSNAGSSGFASYSNDSDEIDFRKTPTGYTLAPIALTARTGGAGVTVGGTFVWETRAIEAGRPTPAAVGSFGFPCSSVYTFRADGTYGRMSANAMLSEEEGVWAVTEPGIVRITRDGGTAYDAAFEVRDGDLWLMPYFERPGSEDPSEFESTFGAAAGSLDVTRRLSLAAYTRD